MKVVESINKNTALEFATQAISEGCTITTGLDKKHLQAYLDEFCYRFNRRKWQDQLFNRLLHACAVGPVVTYAELTL